MEQTMKFEEPVLKFKKLNYVEGVDEMVLQLLKNHKEYYLSEHMIQMLVMTLYVLD